MSAVRAIRGGRLTPGHRAACWRPRPQQQRSPSQTPEPDARAAPSRRVDRPASAPLRHANDSIGDLESDHRAPCDALRYTVVCGLRIRRRRAGAAPESRDSSLVCRLNRMESQRGSVRVLRVQGLKPKPAVCFCRRARNSTYKHTSSCDRIAPPPHWQTTAGNPRTECTWDLLVLPSHKSCRPRTVPPHTDPAPPHADPAPHT